MSTHKKPDLFSLTHLMTSRYYKNPMLDHPLCHKVVFIKLADEEKEWAVSQVNHCCRLSNNPLGCIRTYLLCWGKRCD